MRKKGGNNLWKLYYKQSPGLKCHRASNYEAILFLL